MNNTILIGYMGCGKTTIGIKLSYRGRVAMLDTDKMIEQQYEKTISDIFATEGEAAFRQMETDMLKSILEYKDRYIISVGGGLPLRAENRELLKKLGNVIYLRAKPDTIYERLKNDTTRPLLQCENPQKKITEMLAERSPIYEKAATAVVDVDGKSFEEILSEIQGIIKTE